MTPLISYLSLLAVHWVADFVLQTHWQASNKSKRMDALCRHVGSYTAVLALGSAFIFPAQIATAWGAAFVMANGGLHLATDYYTSRWSSALYAKQDWHNFFVVIGLDQLIHQATLAATMLWLFNTSSG
jgi:hypothetical protein